MPVRYSTPGWITGCGIDPRRFFPTRIRFCSSSRCSGANRTAYLSLIFTATPNITTSSPAKYDYQPVSHMTFGIKVDLLIVLVTYWFPLYI